MVIKHSTDEEIQLFATRNEDCALRVIEHIQSCHECTAKVETYRLLIKAIRQQPRPAFDLELSATVLKQIGSQTRDSSLDRVVTWIFIFICAGLVGTVFYFFRGFLNSIFQGIGGISIYLIVIPAITVVGMLFVEMYRSYQKEMRSLDMH